MTEEGSNWLGHQEQISNEREHSHCWFSGEKTSGTSSSPMSSWKRRRHCSNSIGEDNEHQMMMMMLWDNNNDNDDAVSITRRGHGTSATKSSIKMKRRKTTSFRVPYFQPSMLLCLFFVVVLQPYGSLADVEASGSSCGITSRTTRRFPLCFTHQPKSSHLIHTYHHCPSSTVTRQTAFMEPPPMRKSDKGRRDIVAVTSTSSDEIRSGYTTRSFKLWNRRGGAAASVVPASSFVPKRRTHQKQQHHHNEISNHNKQRQQVIKVNQQEVVQSTTKAISGRLVSASIVLVATVGAGYYYRDLLWNVWTVQAGKFRTALLQQLTRIQGMGWKGNVFYVLFLAVWEACGLPTTPVETSAGMAFPLRQVMWMNPLGKNIGAFGCIMLIRYQFSARARQFLSDKESSRNLFELVNASASETPFRVATLLRFAPFPELFKHVLLALLEESLKNPWIILLAVILHGTPFSLLWAMAGHEASQQLLFPNTYESSRIVQLGVAGCALLGLVVVPTLFGLWINNLRIAKYYSNSDDANIMVEPVSHPHPPPKNTFDI